MFVQCQWLILRKKSLHVFLSDSQQNIKDTLHRATVKQSVQLVS